jgi:hypothetical protein
VSLIGRLRLVLDVFNDVGSTPSVTQVPPHIVPGILACAIAGFVVITDRHTVTEYEGNAHLNDLRAMWQRLTGE